MIYMTAGSDVRQNLMFKESSRDADLYMVKHTGLLPDFYNISYYACRKSWPPILCIISWKPIQVLDFISWTPILASTNGCPNDLQVESECVPEMAPISPPSTAKFLNIC